MALVGRPSAATEKIGCFDMSAEPSREPCLPSLAGATKEISSDRAASPSRPTLQAIPKCGYDPTGCHPEAFPGRGVWGGVP